MSPVKKGGTNTGDYCSSLSYGLFGQGHHHHHLFNPFCYIYYSMPNPLAYVMAFNNLSLSFSLLEYSGSKSTLKHVWDVGNLSVSGPFLAMIIFNFPSPPTGALSVPVVNCKNSLFCSSVNEWTISQNSLVRKKTTVSKLEIVLVQMRLSKVT